jgi:hypothetical protein
MTDFSALAPVPLGHFQTGHEIASRTGFVAVRSREFELFRDEDARSNDPRVPLLIYPSRENNSNIRYPEPWVGWSIDAEESDTGRHSQNMSHRPPNPQQRAGDNHGYWAVFWHVERLTQFSPEQSFLISRLGTVKGGLRKSAAPRGPELVITPDFLAFPE